MPNIVRAGHSVPDWYTKLVPVTAAGRSSPNWSITTQLNFMESFNISHTILSISTPGSTVFPGDRIASVALARLLNEWHAALVRTYPAKFSFLAVIPLPYAQQAITEAIYCLSKLGAIGIGLLSNHEGYYLGNPNFESFFTALNNVPGKNHTVLIHPSIPYLHYDGQLIEPNPTFYAPGTVEFYFDTARTITDLIVTGTVQNFSNIRYQIPHTGDSFPSIIDRFLSTTFPVLNTVEIYRILQTRFWWDSAGPTYTHQVQGLAYDIPKTQLTFGSISIPDTINFSFGTGSLPFTR